MELPSHQLTMTVLMTPDMANFAGNVHGGTILKFLDQVAYACASRYAGRRGIAAEWRPEQGAGNRCGARPPQTAGR